MNDIDMDKLEYLRDRYHSLIEVDHNIVEDIYFGSILSLDAVVQRLNEQDKEIRELKKKNEEIINGVLEDIATFSTKTIVKLQRNVGYD